MIVLGLVLIMVMLLIGGMAIDFMRFEYERARIQSLADSSALSAASLRRTGVAEVEAEEVVIDWFEKAGMRDALVSVVGIGNMNGRTVEVDTRTITRPYFLHMVGLEELAAVGAGHATESRTNVEISLVLDVSGSMVGSKLTTLKRAASDFVEELMTEDAEDRLTISLVPYTGQVVVGKALIDRYNVVDKHDSNYCVDVPSSAYYRLGLPQNFQMRQHVFADTYNSSNTTSSWSDSSRAPEPTANRWCPTSSDNQIRPISGNPHVLNGQINNMTAVGATSIDLGLRWGAALIDPDSRPVISSMISAGLIDPIFRGRPFDYDDQDTTKVIVLMTDGSHWPNEFVAEGYRYGPSPIYKHSDGNYSIHHPSRAGTDKYWVPHRSAWQATAWVGQTCRNNRCTLNTPDAGFQPITWQQVWREMRVAYVANQLYRRAIGGTVNDHINRLRVREGTINSNDTNNNQVSDMNQRMLNLCQLLKNQRVLIFGVAFEAPTTGANLIRTCASPGRFINAANEAQLESAFRDITRQIISLRLTL